MWSRMPGHAQSYPKFYLMNELSYKFSFWHVVRVHRSQEFAQSFQVGGVRHAQNGGQTCSK